MLTFPVTDCFGKCLWVRSLCVFADDGFGNALEVPLETYRFVVGDWLYRDQ